ncbi:MAG: hypothetical protein CMO80_01020 [Verrucomicrobiales bacterium]|nr:hypothetical protein [Verrucomicrobiales bacterium]
MLRAFTYALLLLLADDIVAQSGLDFRKDIQPLLEDYCHDCHADGAKKGDLELDQPSDFKELLNSHEKWLAVWRNLRAQTMPPAKKTQPSEAEREKIMRWIERDVFQVDPANPDPGRVTIRRLNRQEYSNTIWDLFGIKFDATEEFPPDDTGYGFDTIGDVLSISPLLMEKYIKAAESIVEKAVPTKGPRIPTSTIAGSSFRSTEDKKITGTRLVFEKQQRVEYAQSTKRFGQYKVTMEFAVSGSMEASAHAADIRLLGHGAEFNRAEIGWDNRKSIYLSAKMPLKVGDNTLAVELIPKREPEPGEEPLRLNIKRVFVQGPMDGSEWKYPGNYKRIFIDGPPPDTEGERHEYARDILRRIADRAFRRPVDDTTLDRLADLAIFVDNQPGQLFEKGIAHAVTAILVSPRFLFRAEIQPEPNNPGKIVNIDEFSLASRLSYFLWNSLPDERLFDLARKGELRKNLRAEVDRMLGDGKSTRFVENFVGQWLQTRDVENVNVDVRRILRTRDRRAASRVFNYNIRRALRYETETFFRHLLKENERVLDILDADYTFVDRHAARFYGFDDFKGIYGRYDRYALPADSKRGGILTQGSFLIVTSYPTRTSPVRRGLFILENILGTPAPPAPPDVPELEETTNQQRDLTMAQALEVHRSKALCASCHSRFDPLGLALENYNALGLWRDTDRGSRIETGGQLMTGEEFNGAKNLGQVLATERKTDFYRCLSEKLLTYAIGRGMEYYDTPTIDRIVAQLEREDGKMRSLIYGVVESAPFQKRRGDGERLK